MQKWEYLTIVRGRASQFDKQFDAYKATDWDKNVVEMLPKLGQEGWELVAISPRSSYMGGARSIGGATSIAYDFAGFTDSEVWVFKRPIE